MSKKSSTYTDELTDKELATLLREKADELESPTSNRRKVVFELVRKLAGHRHVRDRQDGTGSYGRVSFGNDLGDTPGVGIFAPGTWHERGEDE